MKSEKKKKHEARQKLIEVTEKTGERQNLPVHVTATVPTISNEPVAKFIITLSLKQKTK